MADLPNYGLDADLKRKMDAKYDVGLENDAADWIEAITKASVKGNFAAALKSGEVLCNLINAILPGKIKVNKAGMPFKERENISNFIKACTELGVKSHSIFNPDDLYEEKNMLAVVNCIHRLGAVVQTNVPTFTGPTLGIADASHVKETKRDVGPATQTGGLAGAMEKSEVNTSKNIVRNTGGAEAHGTSTLKPAAASTEKTSSSPRPHYVEEQKEAYGLDADLKAKMDAKYDTELENEVAAWIEAIINEPVKGNFAQALRSGEKLCNLMNAIKAGTIHKVNKAGMPFKERENISNFLKACGEFGVPNYSIFNPDDLYEEKNMGAVVNCINRLGAAVQTHCPDFKGPVLGIADTSHVKADLKRDVGPATQTGGLASAMDKSDIDTSHNIVKDVGGAKTADKGGTKFGEGAATVMERSHIDRSNDVGRGIA
mmetsp:Transcript_45633/g.105931  ORF Transcript_45633/g.105931 Transcript_45633/m.105931 type:complete len:430 (-) Transcript_45633:35-1324(-)